MKKSNFKSKLTFNKQTVHIFERKELNLIFAGKSGVNDNGNGIDNEIDNGGGGGVTTMISRVTKG